MSRRKCGGVLETRSFVVAASLQRLCVTAIAHPCAFTLALLVSHRAKLGASIIAHPCATRKLRVLPPAAPKTIPRLLSGRKCGGVSNCGHWWSVHRAPTLCDRHRASLRDPQKAGSPARYRHESNKPTQKSVGLLLGADGGGRTRTVLLPTDFESVTSANSITSADIVFVKAHCVTKITISQFDYYIIAEKCCQ